MAPTVDLQQKARDIRRTTLQASFDAKACHIPSALSCIDILVDIHYRLMKLGDIFVFSKASGVAAYYAILADKGMFPKEKLAEYLAKYPLPSTEVPGVVHSCGSLGHGLPVAVGLAYANPRKRVYVLMSDGECQEGTTYEACLFARQKNLNNLYVIVDNNRIQALDFTSSILDLTTAFAFMKSTLRNCEIVETVKGEGVDFLSSNPDSHYLNLTPELLERALQQI